jgi:hypothetical protein
MLPTSKDYVVIQNYFYLDSQVSKIPREKKIKRFSIRLPPTPPSSGLKSLELSLTSTLHWGRAGLEREPWKPAAAGIFAPKPLH